MFRTIRSLAVSGLLITFSTIIALLFAEVAVRTLLPQQLIELHQDVYVPADGFGFKLKKDNDTRVNRGDGEVHLLTDSDGYRIGEAGRRDADINILALGDSFLEALQVNYEQTMTALIEDRLSQGKGASVSILNTGVSKYNPNHYLMTARKELARRKFSLVVVFVFMANDVVDERVSYYEPLAPTTKHTLRVPENLGKREIIDAVLYPVNDFLENRSHLFVLFKDRGRTLLARLGLTPYYFPSVMKKATANSGRWQLTADILLDIERLASSYNTPVLFVLLPASYQVNKKTFDWYLNSFDIDPALVDLDQPSKILTSELTKRNLKVIDTTGALRKAYINGAGELYGKVDPHFAPKGHQVAAETLMPYIRSYYQGTGSDE